MVTRIIYALYWLAGVALYALLVGVIVFAYLAGWPG